jgi:hypothetical protein
MIDTVRYFQSRAYSHPLPLKQAIVAGGAFLAGFQVKCVGWDTYAIIHEQSKLRAVFCANTLRIVEVSLPRLLFGHNGKLLSWQSDINAALLKADSLLDRFSLALHSGRVFKRVDLVWQFQGNSVDFVAAHSHCRHPMMHDTPIEYGDTGLEWRGSKLKIKMYDKLLEQTKRPGNVIRLEVELRGKRMKSLLANGAQVTSLNFGTCYLTYRSIVQKFSTKLVPKITDTIDLLAFVQQKYSMNLWPHWKRHYKNPQSRNRARKEFLARKLHYFQIDWAKLLPPNRPFWRVNTDPATHGAIKIALLKRRMAAPNLSPNRAGAET